MQGYKGCKGTRGARMQGHKVCEVQGHKGVKAQRCIGCGGSRVQGHKGCEGARGASHLVKPSLPDFLVFGQQKMYNM